MSNKDVLFDALTEYPTSVGDSAFPSLSIPASPNTVQDAIIASAKANIEVVKFLNSFGGIKVRELFGMVGMLSPSTQAIAAGFLQSDGAQLTSGSVKEIIKLLGDESAGGHITGNIEDSVRRASTGTDLSLLETAITFVPALAGYSGILSPLISTALEIYSKGGRIAENIGYILFQEVADLIKQIIINELYSHDDPDSTIDQASLKNIADRLKSIDETLADTEGVIEIEGTRVWTHSKIVDGAD